MSTNNMYESGDYLNNNPTWHSEDSPWKAKHIYNIISKNQIKYSKIAEIGCGAGKILENLSNLIKDSSVRFDGYDISPQAIELASTIKSDRIKFHLCDLTEKEPDDYDILLIIDVIEHIPDYLTFLEKCKSKAKYKIFHIPLDISALSVLLNRIVPKRYEIGHLHYFTYESALAVLKDTGYEIIDCFYTNSAIGLFKQHPSIPRGIVNIPRIILSKLSVHLTARLFGGFSLLVLTK
jgi:SAM-dependent methyltransferase